MIERDASQKLKQLAEGFPVIALTGPRQSGKTTLVRELFKEHDYLSLEDLDVREEAREDPRGFLRRQQKDFILDEVQHVPELFNYLQSQVDETRRMGGVVLTGSQNFLLMERITQSLAGRIGLLPLLPFSWSELRNDPISEKSVNEVLFAGAYPPIFDRQVSPADWYSRYVQTYIDRDARLIRNIGDLSRFQRFVKLCAGRIGQLVNFTSLASDCGVDTKTAQSWMSVLEESYIVLLLQPHHRNFNKRLVKQPKLYFVDTGVACALLGLENADQLSTHYLRGGLFENWVIMERLKKRFNAGQRSNLYFWRSNTGHEIDLLQEDGPLIHACEIKVGETLQQDWLKGLQWFQRIAEPAPSLELVYGGERTSEMKGVTITPWRKMD
ncbi:MAG: ATP-binding protein [Verrucomicrobia bacterium]|nr:ATP-binding protein [Verrucomicrobiota bacterium]MDA1066823.1 ATP-binding protein [Verrucomicrobiota bacterium]